MAGTVKKEVSHRAKAHQHEHAVLMKTWLKKHVFSNIKESPTPSHWRESRLKDFICRSTRPPSLAAQSTHRKKRNIPCLAGQKGVKTELKERLWPITRSQGQGLPEWVPVTAFLSFCVIVAWQWKGVPHMGLTPLGMVVFWLGTTLGWQNCYCGARVP